MQLCYVIELYRPCGLSWLEWGLVWVVYDLKVFFMCARARSRHLMTLQKKSKYKSIILIYNLKIYLLYLFYSNIFNYIIIYIYI